LDWITALRAPAIRKLAEAGVVAPSLFDQRDLAEIVSPEFPGERLVACYNPLLAEQRTRKRQELLAATEKELDKVVAATQRARRPLRGADHIGLRVGKVLGRYKVGKHFVVTITEDECTYQRDTEKIEAEAALDGIYVVRTSVEAETLGTDETVRAYKGLAVAERAFRSLFGGGPEGAPDPPSPGRSRTGPRVRVHAGLLRGMAHARGPGPDPVRRRRPARRRGRPP
jgi:hypothetical protein